MTNLTGSDTNVGIGLKQFVTLTSFKFNFAKYIMQETSRLAVEAQHIDS
jgi:hypothetical protein